MHRALADHADIIAVVVVVLFCVFFDRLFTVLIHVSFFFHSFTLCPVFSIIPELTVIDLLA